MFLFRALSRYENRIAISSLSNSKSESTHGHRLLVSFVVANKIARVKMMDANLCFQLRMKSASKIITRCALAVLLLIVSGCREIRQCDSFLFCLSLSWVW
mgnify:CR=1 FL=1